jgi:hypothetical protein
MRAALLAKFSAALFTLAVLVVLPYSTKAATIVIQNADGTNTGFNDPTAVSPVGGNTGTTLGQQRLNAFQFAANIWGVTLSSSVTITIRASWASLPCSSSSGTLGQAGSNGIFRDFPNAPFAGTWYSAALANALSGTDLDPSSPEINAQFNSNIGNAGCLDSGGQTHFYLGLDNNHGSDIDLVTVLIHEFSHGLGFQTFTDSGTGALNSGFPSVYDRFALDDTTGKTWVQMTDAERQASAINTGNLVWSGNRVTSDVHSVLGTPRLRVNSPAAISGNYVVGIADFGARLSSPGITANVVLASPTDGCSALTNGGAISGSIALIDRGNCAFVSKVKNAQNAGAVGVVIANTSSGVIEMGGADATITIPSVMVSQADGNTIKGQLASGVNGTLLLDTAVPSGADSSGRALLFAPNPVQAGSSVSHWDTSAFPNQLMEPLFNADLTHSVTPPQDLTSSLLRDVGWIAATGSSVQFSASSYSVSEGAGHVTITVTRTGDTSGSASVDYKTVDDPAAVRCDVINHTAYARCDYATTLDTLTFAPGEISKTFAIPIIDDSYAEGDETYQVALSNPSIGVTLGAPATATVTIIDNDAVNGPNPILLTNSAGVTFFVRQHYLDFLAREPEPGEPWSAILNGCANQFNTDPSSPSAGCDRLTVSGSFFGSPEFLSKGVYTIVFYRVAFTRLPDYLEFAPDLRSVTGATAAETNAKRAAFANNFVLRTEFVNAYGGMTNSTYVTTLMGHYSLSSITTPDPANPDGGTKVTLTTNDLINGLNASTLTRAQVLRAIVQSDQVSLNFEAVNAFVASQYYGYLRRTPDTGGFNSWVSYLNAHPSDFRTMVNGFMNSIEYRLRFGPT